MEGTVTLQLPTRAEIDFRRREREHQRVRAISRWVDTGVMCSLILFGLRPEIARAWR